MLIVDVMRVSQYSVMRMMMMIRNIVWPINIVQSALQLIRMQAPNLRSNSWKIETKIQMERRRYVIIATHLMRVP